MKLPVTIDWLILLSWVLLGALPTAQSTMIKIYLVIVAWKGGNCDPYGKCVNKG